MPLGEVTSHVFGALSGRTRAAREPSTLTWSDAAVWPVHGLDDLDRGRRPNAAVTTRPPGSTSLGRPLAVGVSWSTSGSFGAGLTVPSTSSARRSAVEPVWSAAAITVTAPPTTRTTPTTRAMAARRCGRRRRDAWARPSTGTPGTTRTVTAHRFRAKECHAEESVSGHGDGHREPSTTVRSAPAGPAARPRAAARVAGSRSTSPPRAGRTSALPASTRSGSRR